MQNLSRFGGLFRNMGGMDGVGYDTCAPDTSEQVYVSSLALLKMLKHARAGVPMEVMGLMLGYFIDEYTVRVVDVFSMPQSGNSVSVEAVDPVYQTEMLEQLQRTGRPEVVVGWYHSHPGFGCWFSGTDVSTQQSFEKLNSRAVGVVVDPVQSVKGKVVIDCFRIFSPSVMLLDHEPRQTTSNIGHLQKPAITALVHGLNRNYYSIVISYRKNEFENKMLLNLRKQKWLVPLKVEPFSDHQKKNCDAIASMRQLSEKYTKMINDELKKTPEELVVSSAGKLDPKKRLQSGVDDLMSRNILHSLGSMVNALVI